MGLKGYCVAMQCILPYLCTSVSNIEMKIIRLIVIVLFLQTFADCIISQSDTSLVLKEIKLYGQIERLQSFGSKKEEIYKTDKINQQAQDLGVLLNQRAGIYTKSYGANSLATASIRGGSAGHTLLLWNGIPLSSPTLGLLDFALIPAMHSDLIGIHKGGNSALWGSGAIGGVINLQNQWQSTKPRLQVMIQRGSFGQHTSGVGSSYSNGRMRGSTHFSFIKADNNFNFQRSPNSPIEKLPNASFVSSNFTQDVYFKINNKNWINAHYWWQESSKAIPPTTTQSRSLANQKDVANRFLLDWTRLNNKSKLQAKIGLLSESQKYTDPAIKLKSNNVFASLISELNFTQKFKTQQELLLGATSVYTDALANGYAENIHENRLAFWASHRIVRDRFKWQSSVRAELVDGELIPLTPSLGLELGLLRNLKMSTKISRNYRLPTLNDRYWMPGGNQDLLPENGWSQELSFLFHHKAKSNSFSATVYNRNIKNWILWSPSEGQGFWQAQNLTEVWSRGLELEAKQNFDIGNIHASLSCIYNLVKSTNQVELTLPKIVKGEQLIYTPVHQLTNQISFELNDINFSINHIYRSKNKGINEDIEAYHLINFDLGYGLEIREYQVEFFGGLYNALAEDYFVIERRPMPLRNFAIGLKLKIK